jgi:hypothetical protein
VCSVAASGLQVMPATQMLDDWILFGKNAALLKRRSGLGLITASQWRWKESYYRNCGHYLVDLILLSLCDKPGFYLVAFSADSVAVLFAPETIFVAVRMYKTQKTMDRKSQFQETAETLDMVRK